MVAASLPIGHIVEGRFEIEKPALRGGMAAVYRARDQQSGQTVALKWIEDPDVELTARFYREASALATLHHPYVVRYVDHGSTSSGGLYIAMEWLPGETLAARLARTALSLRETLSMAQGIANALSAVHALGRVHRDLKPANIMCTPQADRPWKLIDFGIVRGDENATTLTQVGAILGTPGYMSPEQARGDSSIQATADVFSLGCILFQCLSGQPPFAGCHSFAILAKILFVDPPRLEEICPTVPPAWSQLVDRMLSKNPSRRPQNAADLEEELAALGAGLTEAAGAVVPGALRKRSVISAVERRLVSIVAITPSQEAASERVEAGVRIAEQARNASTGIESRTELLADGSVLAMLVGSNQVVDRAAQAARYALRLRNVLDNARMVLVTAFSEERERISLGEVMDQAAILLERAQALPTAFILIDETTRALLGARFDVLEQNGAALLYGERVDDGAGRLLLGKTTPFVGRGRLLQQAVSMAEIGFTEMDPAAFLVVGAAGAGKSRFRHELLARLRLSFPNMALALGRGDALGGNAAFGLLRSALRNFFQLEAGTPLPAQREKITSTLADIFGGVEHHETTLFVGELAGVPFPDDATDRLRAARRDGQLMECGISAAWEALVRAIGKTRPFLLALEDMHWGDPSSLKTLNATIGKLDDVPFVIAAFSRIEAREEILRQWSKMSTVELRLAALPDHAAGELVRAVLGPSVPAETVTTVVRRAEGNAFYLEELIRAVSEGRGNDLPPTVLGMVEARLSTLDAATRRVLRAASIFGEIFWKNGVAGMFDDLDAAEQQTCFNLLEEREIVTRRQQKRFAGEDEFAFRHALVREGAYAMLTDIDRKRGHIRAAQWLVQKNSSVHDGHGSGNPEHHAVIAHHFTCGEAWQDAATHHEYAAKASVQWNALVEARKHDDEALATLGKLPDSTNVQRRRLEVMLHRVGISYTGDPVENLQLLERAESLATALPLTADPKSDDRRILGRVHYWMGRCHYYAGAYPAALGYYRRVLDEARELEDDELMALPSGALGRVCMARGEFLSGRPLLMRALGPLERTEQTGDWIVSALFVAVSFGGAADGPAALEWIRRAMDAAQRFKINRDVSITHTMAGVTLLFLGKPQEAVETCKIGIAAAAARGDELYRYLGYANGAWAYTRLGAHEAAEAAMEQAEAIQRAIGRRLLFADWFEAIRVEMAARAGRTSEAISRAEQYLPAMRAAGTIFAEALVHQALAIALMSLGPDRMAEAQAHFEESIATFERGGVYAEAARSRYELARIHRARGDLEMADRCQQEAEIVLAPLRAD